MLLAGVPQKHSLLLDSCHSGCFDDSQTPCSFYDTMAVNASLNNTRLRCCQARWTHLQVELPGLSPEQTFPLYPSSSLHC